MTKAPAYDVDWNAVIARAFGRAALDEAVDNMKLIKEQENRRVPLSASEALAFARLDSDGNQKLELIEAVAGFAAWAAKQKDFAKTRDVFLDEKASPKERGKAEEKIRGALAEFLDQYDRIQANRGSQLEYNGDLRSALNNIDAGALAFLMERMSVLPARVNRDVIPDEEMLRAALLAEQVPLPKQGEKFFFDPLDAPAARGFRRGALADAMKEAEKITTRQVPSSEHVSFSGERAALMMSFDANSNSVLDNDEALTAFAAYMAEKYKYEDFNKLCGKDGTAEEKEKGRKHLRKEFDAFLDAMRQTSADGNAKLAGSQSLREEVQAIDATAYKEMLSRMINNDNKALPEVRANAAYTLQDAAVCSAIYEETGPLRTPSAGQKPAAETNKGK